MNQTSETTNAQEDSVLQTPVAQQPNARGESKKPQRMWIGILALFVLIAGGVYAFIAFSQKTQPSLAGTIKIGVLGTFNSDADTGSFPALRGVQLAKEDLGAANIEVLQADTQCDPALAPAAIQKLIDQHVVAIIGDACSSSSLAALPLANKYKVVMVSPSASSVKLSIPNDYFFRVVPPDIYQGQFLAKLLINKGFKNAAIVYSNEDYGIGLTAIFKENFEKLGGKVVASEGVARESTNVVQEVDAIKASKPDAIVILSNAFNSGVALMKQARASGIQVPFFASDGIYDSALLTDGGTAVEGLTITFFSGGTKEFKQSFAAEFGAEIGIDESAEAYDAFKAIYLAIQKGARTGEEIAHALPGITFAGASTNIVFDKNGDVSKDYHYVTLQVKNGKFVPLDN